MGATLGWPRNRRRLLLATSDFGGGTGVHIIGLVDLLQQRGWQVRILCQGASDLIPPAGIELLDDPPATQASRFPVAQLRQLRQMRIHVRDFAPTVVHTYFYWPVLYARTLRRLGFVGPLVENREDLGFNVSEAECRLLRMTTTIPDRIVCVAAAVREVVMERERVSPARAVVIRNGVSLEAPSPTAEERQRLRGEIGLDPDDRVVGMVSNLNRAVKGVRYFVESMPLIVAREPRARFLILGDGHEKDSLLALTRTLGIEDRVVFAGFRSDVSRFYPLMDVSVLTSLSEGLSIALLESMRCGLPVVATRVGGNPELVREGETGFLVPPKDPRAFADAVVQVLTDRVLRDRMGRNGRAVIEREHSLMGVTDQYEALYEEVLEQYARAGNTRGRMRVPT